MPAGASDIKFYKSSVITNDTTNGGVISANEITDNIINNLFPDLTDAERTAGGTRYRKLFTKNTNSNDIAIEGVAAYIGCPSFAGDAMLIKAGTDTDTQAAADDYTSWSSAGTLNAGVSAAATELVVNFETAAGVYDDDVIRIKQQKISIGSVVGVFTAGEKIAGGTSGKIGLVSNAQATYLIVTFDAGLAVGDVITGQTSGATANITAKETLSEFATVDTVSWGSSQATITLTAGIANNYLAGCVISGMLALADLEPTSSGWTETSAAGTYNESSYPLVLYNIGSVSDYFTLELSSASAFTVTGTVSGLIGSGTTAGDFQPVNGTSYYMKIAAAGWGGMWANGDTITFTTKQAANGVWIKEVWAAGVASYSENTVIFGVKGASA